MVLTNCNNAELGSMLFIVKNILNIIMIIAPILAIISLSILLFKKVKDPDDKKGLSKIKNSINALVIIFLIPTIINAFMYMLGDKSDFSSCWVNAKKPTYSNTYMNPNPNSNKESILYDPSEYEKGEKKKNNSNSKNDKNSSNITTDNTIDQPVTSCGNLEYCNKFLTSMVNNSRRLSEAIARNHAPVTYSWPKAKKTWADAIATAEKGELVATTCLVPANWGVTDIIGKHSPLNSVGMGGFRNYKGKITQYTKQYTFDGTMSVKTAIQKGMIQPGDIVGVKGHTFAIYSVDQKKGSAVVFDGGHRFTNTCKDSKCSPMFTYSASGNASMKLYQIIRWVK